MNFKNIIYNYVHIYVLLLLQLIQYLLSINYIPILSPVITFFYMSYIPGYIIIRIIFNNEIDVKDLIIYSISISIFFLIFIALLVNELVFIFGITRPLVFDNINNVMNVFILFLTFILFLKNDKEFIIMETKIEPICYLYFLIPFINIYGLLQMNLYKNNFYMLIIILLITFMFTLTFIKIDNLSDSSLFLIIFILSNTIIYNSSLISNWLNIFGSDANAEYYVSQLIFKDDAWISNLKESIFYGRINSMLSVTLLPHTISNVTKINLTWIYKLIYPFYLSMLPCILFLTWKNMINKSMAFLSSFMFISFNVFYSELLGLNRQIIAEVFLTLLIYTLYNSKITKHHKSLFYIIFSALIIVSHYAIAITAIFYFSFVYIFIFLYKYVEHNLFDIQIKLDKILLFFLMMFFWYAYTSDSKTLMSIVTYSDYVISSFSDIFNIYAREQSVLRGLGLESSPSLWHTIGRIIAYLTEFLILLGFINIITDKKNNKINNEYMAFQIISFILLGSLIIIPGLSHTLNMTRFYHILLIFLSPLCPLGAQYINKFISYKKTKYYLYILFFLVLIPYFLFQTSFMYEVAGSDSWSISLSKYKYDDYRLYYHAGYINDFNAFHAIWVNKYINLTTTSYYGDHSVQYVQSYGGVPWYKVTPLTNTTNNDGKVLLSYYNINSGKILFYEYEWNISGLLFYNYDNLIYTNSKTKIFSK